MKLALFVALGFSASFAFANGLDAKPYNYTDEAFFPKAAPGCINGTKQYFIEMFDNMDGYENVSRTCKDGVYYPRSITKIQPCQNGAVASWSKYARFEDGETTWQFVCVNGKYIARD